MNSPIKSVTIVGGGTAGWITAGLIAAKHGGRGDAGLKIRLIESPDIPIVGVGEGTWPTMRSTLHAIGVREADFFQECDASFKQGTKFCRWATGADDDFYYHPFMAPQGFLEGNLAPHWLSTRKTSFSTATCIQEHVCEKNLAPKQMTTPEYAGVTNYGYHLNAGKYSEFLKRHCVDTLNVELIIDNVIGVVSAENGDIAALKTERTGEIAGDLFIDCTGFRSLLLGKHYGVKFVDKSGVLFVDTALAVQVPYRDEQPILSQTVSTGQSAGWIWDIGLSTRRGVGHLFSSAHSSEEDAVAQLRAYLAPTVDSVDDLAVRKIPIAPGHREVFWKNNCVAVGLSAGFLEPLEASALVLVELSANMIASQMPASRAAMEVVSKRFNRKFQYRWDRIIDFLKLHYVLSQRTDNAFWTDNRDRKTIPDSLQENMDLWAHQSPWLDDFDHKDEVFPSASYQFVLYGMGFETAPDPRGQSDPSLRFAADQFAQIERMKQQLLSILPTNRALLSAIASTGMRNA